MGSKRLHIRLITWKDDRASKLTGELDAAAFTVDADPFDAATLKTLAQNPPDAVVIDLGRLPSQGRDVGVAIRTRAGTRHLPLVFVDGSTDKVDRTRQQLPDAIYTVAGKLNEVVRHAVAHPPKQPVVPASNLAGYSGTPLPKKLGIKGGSVVALVGAPEDFETTLGELPEGTTILDEPSPEAAVTLWFLESLATLEEGIEEMAEVAGGGRLWICWPKKASGIATDVTQNQVRSTGLAAGIVDFKICAVDATWSGLCFTKRKQ
jgi:CheY-like chemotaxis protein